MELNDETEKQISKVLKDMIIKVVRTKADIKKKTIDDMVTLNTQTIMMILGRTIHKSMMQKEFIEYQKNTLIARAKDTERNRNKDNEFNNEKYDIILRMNKDRLHMMSENDIKLMCDVIGLLDTPKEEFKYYKQMFESRLGEMELEQRQVDICNDYNKHNCDNDLSITNCYTCHKEIKLTSKEFKEESQRCGKVECDECKSNNNNNDGDRIVTIKCDSCGRLIDTTIRSLENMCKDNNQLLCLYCRKL